MSILAWVEQILVPRLREGEIVGLANLSCHTVDGVQEAIEAAGAALRSRWLSSSGLSRGHADDG